MSVPDIRRSMFKVLRGAQVVGAGFLVTRRLVATCRHVVDACAGARGTGEVRLEAVASQRIVIARVHPRHVTEASQEDLAILEVDEAAVADLEVAVLGGSRGSRDHRFAAYGFPASDPAGTWEPGLIGRVDKEGQPFERLRLHETDVREGFSGGPLLDEQTRRVVGVISARPENHAADRPLRAAEATPSERLRALVGELTLSSDCPYRDLESFRESDAPLWKGRAAVLGELMAVIDTRPSHVTIAGPSGVGKSSLLAAGLVATLRSDERRAGWDVRLMRPGLDPRAALRQAVLGDGSARGSVLDCLERWRERTPGKRLVLAIDQFEDLLLRAAPEDQAALLGFLRELESPRLADLPLTIVAALREGFDERLGEVAAALKDRLFRRMVAMPTTLSRDDVLAIIRQPAEAIGLRFAPDSVATTLCQITHAEFPASADDASAGILATALPVLEVALTQLWQTAGADGAITLEALNALAANQGIPGILTRWADDVYTGLDGAADRAVADDILVELVEFGEPADGSRDKGRRVRLSTLRRRLARHAGLERVLHALIAGRLIVLARGDEATIELIHDAVMLRWAHYSDLRQTNRAFLVWHDWLQREAELWSKPGAPLADENRGRLLRYADLSTALARQQDHGARIGEHATRFIARSAQVERAARQRIRRWQRAAAAAAVVVAVTLGYLLQRATGAEAEANRQAAAARALARAGSAALAVQMSRRDGHTIDAVVAAIALAGAPPVTSGRAPDELLAALADSVSAAASSIALSLDGEDLYASAVSPDDRFIVTRSVDQPRLVLRTRLWSARNGALLAVVDARDMRAGVHRLPHCPGDPTSSECRADIAYHHLVSPQMVRGVAFSPGDSTLWVGGLDGTVRAWSERGAGRTLGSPGGAPVTALAFDAAGKRLLVIDAAGTGRVWDTATGEPLGEAIAVDGPDAAGALSADGRRGAIAGATRAFVFVVGATGAGARSPIAIPAGPPGPGDPDTGVRPISLALSIAADLVAVTRCTGAAGEQIRVWNVAERRVSDQFRLDSRDCALLQFSYRGCELLAFDVVLDRATLYPLHGCGSGTAARGDVTTRLEHLRMVAQLRTDEDGGRSEILEDGAGWIRDTRELFRFLHPDAGVTYAPSRDGRVLLIDHGMSLLERRGASGTRWAAFEPARMRWANRARVSGDGRWLAVAAEGQLRVMATTGDDAAALDACDDPDRGARAVEFAPDGRQLAVRCGRRITLWRDAGRWQPAGTLGPIEARTGDDDAPLWLTWFPGERLLVSDHRGEALWSTADRRRLRTFEPDRRVTATAFTAAGDLAVVATGRRHHPDGPGGARLEVIRVSDGSVVCTTAGPGAGEVSEIEIAGAARLVLAIAPQISATLWRLDDCAPVRDPQLRGTVGVHLAPDGRGVAVVSDAPGESRFWPSAPGEAPRALPDELAPRVLAIDPRPPHALAIAKDRGDQVLLVDPVTAAVRALPELPVTGSPVALRYAPGGALVYARSGDTTVFDLPRGSAAGTRRYTLDVAIGDNPIAWSRDRQLMVAQDRGNTVHVWRWADGIQLTTLRPGCRQARIQFLPDDDGLVIDCGDSGGAIYSLRHDDLLRQACDVMRGRADYAKVRETCDRWPPLPTVELP